MLWYHKSQFYDLILVDREGTVVFRQTFIEPGRLITQRIVNQLVNILVKDNAKRLFRGTVSCQGNIINVSTWLKIPRQIRARLERPVRTVILENNHSSGHWGVEFQGRKESSKYVAKLFEFGRDIHNVLLACIPNQKKIR